MGLTWRERAFTALLGAAAVSGLTTLILFLVEATNVLLPADTKFGIVLDAGSSHTSLFVYQWLANKENDTGVVSQALACRAKAPGAPDVASLQPLPRTSRGLSPVCLKSPSSVSWPGISSYASDPAQAGESLQGCLEEALALIPKAKHQQTPMFLGATGGMRLLSRKNSSQAEDVFAAVSQALSRSPVAFWGAELLAGQDEGALGWVTINYVLGLLVQYSFSGEWIQPLEGTLVGALDMGGASTQITFVPGGPILDTTTQATFRLYGTEHSVYTHSYLCFGHDQMLNRLLAGLVQVGCSVGRAGRPARRVLRGAPTLPAEQPKPPGASPLLPQRLPGHAGPGPPVRVALRPGHSPPRPRPEPHCGGDGEPRGLCRRHPGSLQLLQLRRPRRLRLRQGLPAPRAGTVLREPPRPALGAKLPLGAPGPDPRGTLGSLGPQVGWGGVGRGGTWLILGPPPCALPGHFTPLPQAFSNFYHTFHFLNLTSRPPLATANATIWEFCQRPWKLVEASSPGQDGQLRDYCASGLYILTLLLEGYGFSQETWGGIEFRKQAGGTDIGWTLGYMLNLTGLIPAEAPAQWRAQSYGVWVAGVVFLVLTLTAILGATVVQLWLRD
ncbi:ectonucleoside triphosphate diphosphohydrolase 8 isoform X2 [Monodon monoceros]|uniref:ectonucleoside triphosphate diphosphohydrolase 8 isoform X2 n=1 Tax=Monodon monoceros TaxID=40151 RepID=UPI0010F742B0|nr:ectonucleoside triphosphate diphosphohydrolase 8 isoform X2 [Monodon monoceros]